MNQDQEAIILKFENEYEFDNVLEEIYYIIYNSYDKIAIEEVKQMLLEFTTEEC